MDKNVRYGLNVILIIIIIVVFTPIFVNLNERIFGSPISIFTMGLDPILNILAGFLLSYTFFIPLTLTIFFNKPEKYYAIFAFIGFELFFMLSDIIVLLTFAIIAVIGWLIGEGILRLYSYFKNK